MSSTAEIKIISKAFGPVTISDRQRITFAHGLYGFEELRTFALLDSDHPPFYWLQSIEQVETAFILINPYLIEPSYTLDIADGEIDEIANPSADDLLVFAIVTVPQDGGAIRCNLQGPIIINRAAQLGRQSISLDVRWRVRHPLVPEE